MPYVRTGRPRGRPRYPEPLTPAEQRVLEGVRLGLSNQGIADHLGISHSTVKYHIANMLSKLDLDDRQQLAEWRPPMDARRGVGIPLVARASALFRPRWLAVALGACAALAAVVLLFRFARPAGDPGDEASAMRDESSTAQAQSAGSGPSYNPGAPVTPCPISPPALVYPWQSLTGTGPAYLSGPPTRALSAFRSLADDRIDDPESESSIEPGGTALIWYFAPESSDPISARGRDLGSLAQLPDIDYEGGGSRRQWMRRSPLDIGGSTSFPAKLAAPGCYEYEVTAAGSGEHLVFEVLAIDPESVSTPKVTLPPGVKVAFTVDDRTGATTLAEGRTTGTSVVQLDGDRPSWSPDGESIATVTLDGSRATILVGGVGARNRVTLTGSVMGPLSAVQWLPDHRFGFSARRGATTDSPNPLAQVYVVDIETGEDSAVTVDANVDFSPSWSSDGTAVVYVSLADRDPEIYLKRPDETEPTRLTNSVGLDALPAWSPDGTRILFQSRRKGRIGIWVMEADGGDQHQLAAGDGSDIHASWSPDGSRIVFASDRDGGWQIYTADRDGGDIRQLTDGPGSHWSPSWVADGEYIGFTSNQDGRPDLYLIRPDGTGLQRVTTSTGSLIGTTAWAP